MAVEDIFFLAVSGNDDDDDDLKKRLFFSPKEFLRKVNIYRDDNVVDSTR